jgi:ApaG protein
MDKIKYEISIEVTTDYIDDQSEPDVDRYVFAYTITIANSGNIPAKLLSRHWIITDANGKIQEVTGDGVVGEQPKLNPGEKFSYSSGAVLETPVGAMQGSYRMEAENGTSFDAPIPPFTLAVPGVLH